MQASLTEFPPDVSMPARVNYCEPDTGSAARPLLGNAISAAMPLAATHLLGMAMIQRLGRFWVFQGISG